MHASILALSGHLLWLLLLCIYIAKMAELIRKINAEERYSIEGMGQSLGKSYI